MLFSSSSHVWCWCPTERTAGRLPVPHQGVSNRCETAQEPQMSRPRSAPDACPNLLPKAQVGNKWMLSNGAVEGPLKISSDRLWFSRRMSGLSLHWRGFSGCASACQEPATLSPHQILPTGLRAKSNRYEGPTATGILGGGKEGRISSATNPNINTSESCNKNLLP